MVIPQTHNQDHALRHALAHGRHAAPLVEGVHILLEDLLLCVAPLLRDRVAGHAWDRGLRVGNDLAVLHVEALELSEVGTGAEELGHDGHLLRGVDGLAFAVEVFVANAVRVDWAC